MADPLSAKGVRVYANTGTVAVPVWTLVADLNSYQDTTNRNTQETEVFGDIIYETTGSRRETFQLGGLHNPTDPGQMELNDAEAADAEIEIQVLFAGPTSAGFKQAVKVNNISRGATAGPGLQTISYAMNAAGARVAVAAT